MVISSDWFERGAAHLVREDVIGLCRFGRTLTALHCERISLEADGYEGDDVARKLDARVRPMEYRRLAR